MGDILRKAVEERREKLINALIAFNVYRKEDNRLWGLSLTELEYEHSKLKSSGHPHGDYGSIQWKN